MGKIREELLLLLDTTTGANLIPEDLEKVLTDLVKWNAPVTRMLSLKKANGLTHEFNQITAIPNGQFEGENAVTVISNSTYNRATVQLKVMRVKGRVTGLVQAASAAYINAWKQELSASAKSMGRNIEFGILWGNATADQYQYDGADTAITTNRIDHNAAGTLGLLDQMIDSAHNAGAQMDQFIFVMSPQMVSRMSGLQTEIRKSIPLESVEFPGGFRMSMYRDIPMLPSSFCRPSSQMGALGLASSATAGSLVAGQTYRYRVSAVTFFGEQSASAAAAGQLVAGGQSSVDITFTAVAQAQLYKVYRSAAAGAAGSEFLSQVVAAKTYDGNGTVTGAVVAINDGVADASLSTTDKPYDIQVAGVSGADETIFFLDIDPNQGVNLVGLINPQGAKVDNLVQHIPLAVITDAMDFLLTSYHAPAWKGEIFSSIGRRVRSF
jgi:hypothetical protein